MNIVTTASPDLEAGAEIETLPVGKSALIPMLQRYQQEHGYISQECVRQIAETLSLSENHIYSVASFYSQFRFRPPGRHLLRICLGTACHVQGGKLLSRQVQDKLDVLPGDQTPDGRFDFEEVACLGCCAQAPVVEIDGAIFARMSLERLLKNLEAYE
jgi:NADH-quinone oxidoreductase subunit E